MPMCLKKVCEPQRLALQINLVDADSFSNNLEYMTDGHNDLCHLQSLSETDAN